jgi:hypothetical protein
MSTLQTATNGVLEQFIGVLPASLTTAVQSESSVLAARKRKAELSPRLADILTFNLDSGSEASLTLAAQVSAQISNAINSVASTLSGNTVTLAEVLQACAADLIASTYSLPSIASGRPLTRLVLRNSWQRDSRSRVHHRRQRSSNIDHHHFGYRRTIRRSVSFPLRLSLPPSPSLRLTLSRPSQPNRLPPLLFLLRPRYLLHPSPLQLHGQPDQRDCRPDQRRV